MPSKSLGRKIPHILELIVFGAVVFTASALLLHHYSSPTSLFEGILAGWPLALAGVAIVLIPTLLVCSFVVRMALAAREWKETEVDENGQAVAKGTMRFITTLALYAVVTVSLIAFFYALSLH